MSGTGVGQQDPGDSNSDFTVLAFTVRQMIALMDTMKLAKVVAVTAGSGTPPVAGTVDVQLLVSQIDAAGNSTPHGVVKGLPYLRVSAGNWAIVCDPVVGDIGFVVAADRDISLVKAAVAGGNNPQTTPGSFRKYDIADGIFIGGCLNGTAPTQYVWLRSDGTFKIADGKGNVLESSTSGIALTGSLAVTGNISATGTVIAGKGGADQVGLQTHVHPTAPSGPVSAPTAGT